MAVPTFVPVDAAAVAFGLGAAGGGGGDELPIGLSRDRARLQVDTLRAFGRMA